MGLQADVHGREEHVWDEACEHVPWVEGEQAGREVHFVAVSLESCMRQVRQFTSICCEQAKEHDAVRSPAKTRCLYGGHDGAEDHVAHEHREYDRQSLILPFRAKYAKAVSF